MVNNIKKNEIPTILRKKDNEQSSMTNKISVVVSVLCDGTPEVMNTIQERFEIFVAITGYSVGEIMDDNNILDELNRFINNELVDDLGLEYSCVIINIGYNN
ncbi:hypothetical protein [Pectobacterium brasiliense]|uniref:hypothetical protein n=1 Tax=Pectobacterium brasiliense TaxID=180957 RepID=UPI000D496540|nr:hypothetical protein F152LOC_04274 [Pectobacterium brasiliense]